MAKHPSTCNGPTYTVGDALVGVLKDYPRLLLFTPSGDGSVLKYNDTYASVDVVEETQKGHVSYWREGTAFSTAPMSPRTPNSKLSGAK